MNGLLITEDLIEHCEDMGACSPALAWLRETPRTVHHLCEQHLDWAAWAMWKIGSALTEEQRDVISSYNPDIVESEEWWSTKSTEPRNHCVNHAIIAA